MLITLLGQILQQAVDYELIDRNPVRVGGPSARFLKRARPNRTFLEVDEFHALLDAAGSSRPRRARRQGPRSTRDDRDARARGLSDRRDDGPESRAGGSPARPLQARRREDRGRGSRGRDHALPARRAARTSWTAAHAGCRSALGPLLRHGDRQAPGPGSFPRPHPRPGSQRRELDRAEAGLPPLPAITPHSLRRTWATFAR